jgi:alkylhydroperoxidase family enzyme
MHWKDLRAIGGAEQRLNSLELWRECARYSDRERAALACSEALSRITEVRPHFNDTELADLSLAIATINAWNRLAIPARSEPGLYQPAGRKAGA